MSRVEEMRKLRDRPVVIEAKIHKIRSGFPGIPIIVVEGKSDVAPYEVWIKRINRDFDFRLLPASGKQQVLESMEYSKAKKVVWANVYFIVDRDFDGLRGYLPTETLFCTDRYSFENYLVSHEVLDSLLHDEFECVDEPGDCSAVKAQFSVTLKEFNRAMEKVNFRLFLASRLSIRVEKKEEKLSRFVDISLVSATPRFSDDDLTTLIPLQREATLSEKNKARYLFFQYADPLCDHRGKYLYDFFIKWLDILAEDRRAGSKFFSRVHPIKFSTAAISHRSLAERAEHPEGLPTFVRLIRQGAD